MGQPVWQTPSGSLGTIPEGQYYNIPLTAADPDGSPVYYEIIAGALPSGIAIDTNGRLHGIPKATRFVQAEEIDLAETVTSKFAVRAYTVRLSQGSLLIDRVSDRTFTLSILGQDVPRWATPAGNIGIFYDGSVVRIQLAYTDNDRFDPLRVKLVSGTLPPGLSLSESGLISGYNQLITPFGAGIIPGNDRPGQGWDDFPFDWPTSSVSKNYQFTLEVTDGKSSDIRTFEIFVYARNTLTADNDVITNDSDFITADIDLNRRPIILTAPGRIADVRHDNFFAYKIDALDPDGNPLEYVLTTGPAVGFDESGFPFDVAPIDRVSLNLPPDLSLDSTTGWISGYLRNAGINRRIYNFAIAARQTDIPSIISDEVYFSMLVEGDIDREVTWLTDEDLGIIENGQRSVLSVSARTRSGASLNYRLASPSRQGFLSSIWVTDGGSGYDPADPPQVNFISEFGYGAQATASVNPSGEVDFITIVNPGFGYVSPPEVRILGGGGLGAQARAFVEYNTDEGYASKLPQGLRLLPSGNIAGTVSWKTWILDGGTTTIDATSTTGRPPILTTIDSVFRFNVEAFNQEKTLQSIKEFRIRVLNTADSPVQDVNFVALPPEVDRTFINNLLSDPAVMRRNLIYRPDDPNYGVSRNVEFLHLSGLAPEQVSKFITAMEENHYRKNLTLGEIRTARALDDDGQVLYEVVYSAIIDDQVNNQGVSVSEQVRLPYPARGQTVVYPNSLANMRQRLLDTVGRVSERLPRWMSSRQVDGTVLGYQPAWVIAYAQPGSGDELAYNIRNFVGNQLNTIDFQVDRYELVRVFTQSWDFETQTWRRSAQTTFDQDTTSFDFGDTVFIAPTDTYATSDRDNKYLVFPKTNILG